jgi:hypothetical protein
MSVGEKLKSNLLKKFILMVLGDFISVQLKPFN